MHMQTTATPKTIVLATLQTMLGRKLFHLWNVLTADRYRAGANIPGSRWFPLDEISEAEALKRASKEDEIVVYCAGPSCSASREAATRLSALGFKNVLAYEGGIEDWTRANLPLVRID